MRIGFVSIFFDRGQSVVTKTLMNICRSGGHEVFLFSRMGAVYGKEMQESTGEWHEPNATLHGSYCIEPAALAAWASAQGLDWVVFNEEHDFRLPRAIKDLGKHTATYLDFYTDEWAGHMDVYDRVLCSTHRSRAYVKDHPGATWIGWGINPEIYNADRWTGEYHFFHNAGYLGINWRKGTDLVIQAFACLKRVHPHASLLIHSQVPLEHYPQALQELIKEYSVGFVGETLPPPGLYHKGRVYVYPARLDGLGLSFLEAQACGLRVITTDAPPWREFMDHRSPTCGDGPNPKQMIPIVERRARGDGIAIPEVEPDFIGLVLRMAHCLQGVYTPKEARIRSDNATKYGLLNYDAFSKRVLEALCGSIT